ncbi:MAG: hypothetical protein LN417_00170 [Candidatus Thermoplasmatota archaeon]|nr:hypothetical protein [Candidatus Thermoplasmatota archaeon]
MVLGHRKANRMSEPEPGKKDWANFIVENEEQVGNLMDRVAGHIHQELDRGRRHTLQMARAQARSGLIVTSVVFAIISVGLILTFVLVREAFLSGETFVFFVGALLGSLITFLSERVSSLLYTRELEESVE